jgi:hypothetical protein
MSVTYTGSPRYTAVPHDALFGPIRVGPMLSPNPGRLGAVVQTSCVPSSFGSQMVHNVPLSCDSTRRAITVSTSGKGDPERINLRTLNTDSFSMGRLLWAKFVRRPNNFHNNAQTLHAIALGTKTSNATKITLEYCEQNRLPAVEGNLYISFA